MLLLNAVVPHRSGVAAAIIFFIIVIAESSNDSQVRCSRTCVAENCNSIGIRYGKYCGVGWTGCPGEKPCDDLDACCKIHDECVEKNVFNSKGKEKILTYAMFLRLRCREGKFGAGSLASDLTQPMYACHEAY